MLEEKIASKTKQTIQVFSHTLPANMIMTQHPRKQSQEKQYPLRHTLTKQLF